MADALVETMPVIGNNIPGDLFNPGAASSAGTTNHVPRIIPTTAGGNQIQNTTNYYGSHQDITDQPPPDVDTVLELFTNSVTLEDLDALEEQELNMDEGLRIRARVITNNRLASGNPIQNANNYYSNPGLVHTDADNLNNNVTIPNMAASISGNVGPPNDENNNNIGDGGDGSDSGDDNPFVIGIKSLPPISTFFSLVMILLYFFAGYMISSEEAINVCWSKVVGERQFWRLLVAHFFHFGRLHVLVNVITLMAMGRYLENKINKTAMVILVFSMGVLSNMLYVMISKMVGEESIEMSTYGFAHVHYGLRVVLAMIQEESVHATLVFGIIPIVMSTTWAPWQPLLEVFLLKLIMQEMMPVSGPIAGILSGFIVSYYLRRFKPNSFGREVVPNQSTSRLNTSAWTKGRGQTP